MRQIKMAFNPIIHDRRSIRLKGYDYSRAGLYFITICVQDRRCLFGGIENEQMILNDFGTISYLQWGKLPERFSNMELDVFQIMPNHMHGIIILTDPVGATLAVAQNTAGTGASPAPTRKWVGDIVGAYKSLVAKDCLEIFKQKNPDEMMGKLWQRNYHEHIIRNEQSYQRVSEYIMNNPAKWKDDKFYNN